MLAPTTCHALCSVQRMSGFTALFPQQLGVFLEDSPELRPSSVAALARETCFTHVGTSSQGRPESNHCGARQAHPFPPT